MSLNLKVVFPATGQTKAIRFNMDIPIQQVIKEIKEKISFEGSDHGLFQPGMEGRNKARWLKENHTLKFYNLPQDTEVVFKKKTRPLKVRLVDNTTKTVLIDDTAKVSVIRDTVGKKLGIKSAEEYGLKVLDSDKWLSLGAGLYEQDVNEDDTLVFDKNYFFFDDSIDRSDPVQLHLIYTKAVQSIIEGTYPVTMQEAVVLAGLQCQVTMGNFDPVKHTQPGAYKLEVLLPAQWLKEHKAKPAKVIELVSTEHKKLVNTTEINSKYKYVQTVRQLPTYGITFYTVEIPTLDKKGKKKGGKMQQILLGITREKILQMDYVSKQTVKEYPLVHLRRWASVRGKFTFDFGDHEDSYWTVFTDQGDQISALIAGYIDIIINARKQGVKQIEVDQRTGLATEEDVAISGVAQVGYISGMGHASTGTSHAAPGGQGAIQITDVGSAMRVAELLRDELAQPFTAADRRATRRMSVVGEPQWVEQIVSFEKGTDDDVEKLVDLVMSGNPDKKEVDRIAASVASKLKNFVPLAQRLAMAGADEAAVQTAAQGVVNAVGDVLKNAQSVMTNPYDSLVKSLLAASKQKYDAAMLLMKAAQTNQLSDQGTADLVKALARTIAAAVDGLKYDVDEFGNTLDGQNKTLMNNFGKQLPPATDGLVSATDMLSSALLNPNARKHIIDAGQFLASLANQVDGVSRRLGATPEWLDRIGRSAGAVNDAIKYLIDALNVAEDRNHLADVEDAIKRSNAAVKALTNSGGNQKAMLGAIKEIASAANEVIRQALGVAKVSPPDVRAHLENEASRLKEALADLTEIGKEAIKNPNDMNLRQQLYETAQKVDDGVTSLGADLKTITAAAALRAAAKAAVGNALALTQNIKLGVFLEDPLVLQASGKYTGTDPRVALRFEARDMGDALKNLLGALQIAAQQPLSQRAQEDLLNSTKQIGPQVAKFVANSKRGENLVDAGMAKRIDDEAKATQDRITKLLGAVQSAQNADTSGSDISSAFKSMEANDAQIEAAQFAAASDIRSSWQGDSREGLTDILQQYAESLNQSLDGLSRAALASGPLAPAANEVASGVADLITATEGVTGALTSKETISNMFDLLKKLSADTNHFLSTVKSLRANKTSPTAQASVDEAKAKVQHGLGAIIGTAMGQDNAEIDQAILSVRGEVGNLRPQKDGKDYQTAAKQLTQRLKALNAAAQQVAITARNNPKRVAPTAKIVVTMAKNLTAAANAAAGAAGQAEGTKILNQTKAVLLNTVGLLENASSASLTGHFEPLDSAAQRLGASVASLEGAATGTSFPEVDNAVRGITQMSLQLDNPPANVQGRTRREILKALDFACGNLAGNMSRLISAARMGTEKVGIYATETGESVKEIISSAVAARAPLAQQTAIELDPTVKEYIDKCDEVIASVGPATVAIGNLTKKIGGSARDVASSLEGERQRVYVNSAKALAAGVPKLVAAVKGGKPALISKCAEFLKTTIQKMEAARLGVDVDDLIGGADGAVPVSVQRDLVDTARAVAASASEFLQASGQLAGDPSNTLLGHTLTISSDALSDVVNKVATIARTLDPVKHTCQETAEAITQALAELDVVLVNAGMGLLEKPEGKILSKSKTELAELLQSFGPDITTLQDKVGVSGRDVQQAAERIQLKMPQLVTAVSTVAALEPNPAQARKVVALTKGFGDSLRTLVNDIEVGSDKISESAQTAAEKLGEALSSLKQAEEIFSELSDVAKKIRDMSGQLQQPANPSGRPYTEIKDQIVAAARTTTSAAAALNTMDFSNVGTVSMNSKSLARSLPALMMLLKDAIASVPDQTAKTRLQEAAGDLFSASSSLIEAAAQVAQSDDLPNRAALNEAWSDFTDAMPALLNAAKRGAVGESNIDDGADAIASIINKMNSLAIFAQAGQDLEGVKKSPLPYDQLVPRANAILDKLTDVVGQLADAGNMTEDQLGATVSNFAKGMTALMDATLTAADKAPDSETQQNIINATKAVALSAKQIVLSAKDVQKNKDDTLAARTLKSAAGSFPAASSTLAAVLRGEITSLGAASTAGLDPMARAKAEIGNIASVVPSANATAGTLVESARAVSNAATPLVFATNQDELNDGASEALASVQSLVANVKGASRLAPGVAPQLQQAGKNVTERMAQLLEASSNLDRANPAVTESVAASSGALNESLESLVKVVNQMPGGTGLTLHSAEDIGKRTDKELSAAVEYVKRVVQSLPKNTSVSAPDANANEKTLSDWMTLNTHEIAEATQSLIRAAQMAEAETRNKGDAKYRNDPTWANGLISAAHRVAGGVGRLVQSVEKASTGKLDEEDLVANAKHVAACVKQLYMAARVRQGVSEDTQSQISEASKAVARSTADVVKAAQQAGDLKQQRETTRKRSTSTFGVAGSVVQKLEQQAAILRLEKQLEEARRGLLRMNKAEANSQRNNS